MRYLLLLAIKIYWRLIPEEKRGKCIFRKSCSHYVFEETKNGGLIVGLKSLNYRVKTCNSYFQLYKNPVTDNLEIILANGDILKEDEIASRLLRSGDHSRGEIEALVTDAR